MRRLSEMMEMFFPGIGVSRPFLKLDTQGYDIEVFRGAGDRIHEIWLESSASFLLFRFTKECQRLRMH